MAQKPTVEQEQQNQNYRTQLLFAFKNAGRSYFALIQFSPNFVNYLHSLCSTSRSGQRPLFPEKKSILKEHQSAAYQELPTTPKV